MTLLAAVKVAAAALTVTAGAALAPATATAAPAPAAAATGSAWGASANGATCSIPLSDGKLMVTRTTGYVGGGRYWTSVRLESTGDAAKLVTNRVHGYRARAGLVRVARGITGVVDAPRSWGASSRTPNTVAIVRVVDTVTGAYGATTC